MFGVLNPSRASWRPVRSASRFRSVGCARGSKQRRRNRRLPASRR